MCVHLSGSTIMEFLMPARELVYLNVVYNLAGIKQLVGVRKVMGYR